MDVQDRLLTSKEVLKLFEGHVTYGGLLALVRTKQLKAAKVNGKLIFFEKYVRNWLNKQTGAA